MKTCKNIIYGLVDPRVNLVRYVGKSTSGTRRPNRHKNPANDTDDYRGRWIKQLRHLGMVPGVLVLEECSGPEHLAEAETKWIAYCKSLGLPLVNSTLGGEGLLGHTHSDYTKGLIRDKHLGKPKSESHKEALRKANLGKRLSEETKEKIRVAMQARMSPQEIDRLRTLRVGKTNSDRAKEALRKVNLGIKHTQERRDINAKAQMGRKQSEETKAKRSESLKKAWARRKSTGIVF